MMPSGLGEQAACGGEHDPVERGEPGAAGLAAQHPKLMSENEDLQVLGAVVSVREDQQTRQQADGQPEQEEHRWMVRSACSRGESEFPRPTLFPLGLLMAALNLSADARTAQPGNHGRGWQGSAGQKGWPSRS